MKWRMRKLRTMNLAAVSLILFICFTGFEFVKAWISHAPSSSRHGVYFALAVILTLVSLSMFFEKR
jgi:hypothetical protein